MNNSDVAGYHIHMEDIESKIWAHYRKMCRVAFRVTHRMEDSEDIAMDAILYTLERLYSNNPPIFENGNVVQYLNTATRNRALNFRRKDEVLESLEFDPESHPSGHPLAVEDIWAFIKSTPSWMQEVLKAKIDCTNTEEAAAILDIPVSTFKVRLHRTRKYLKNTQYYRSVI